MSAGMTPQELVQQVFYLQEKVLLDYWPSDDKYKEVIMEANFVLQELQKEEDWSWLRAQRSLGLFQFNHLQDTEYPRYDLNWDDFYKLSSLYGDCVRLYAHKPIPAETAVEDYINYIIPWDYINVPISSTGAKNKVPKKEISHWDHPNVPDFGLYAHQESNQLVFNRPPVFPEFNRVVVVDYQKKFTPLHICNQGCVHTIHEEGQEDTEVTPNYSFDNYLPCDDIEDRILTEIPDPSYVAIRTAYYHAMGSPTAQGQIAYLGDQAQKMLSSMRQNDALATMPDYMEYETPGFFEVV